MRALLAPAALVLAGGGGRAGPARAVGGVLLAEALLGGLEQGDGDGRDGQDDVAAQVVEVVAHAGGLGGGGGDDGHDQGGGDQHHVELEGAEQGLGTGHRHEQDDARDGQRGDGLAGLDQEGGQGDGADDGGQGGTRVQQVGADDGGAGHDQDDELVVLEITETDADQVLRLDRVLGHLFAETQEIDGR